MKNTLTALNNIIFEQLERLQDDEAMKDDAAFQKEIARSKAITNLASQSIQIGNLSLRACQYAQEYGEDARRPVLGLTDGKL